MAGPLKIAQYLQICKTIDDSRVLSSIFKPLASWAQNISGYRRMGLKFDDLLNDDSEIAQEALRRLTQRERDYRVYRHRSAFQLSVRHTELPKEKWLKAEEDDHYLLPLLVEVEKEFKEKEKYDNLVFKK